ncbi:MULTISPECIES: hypothetical protein [unclassified Paenibacillus]|uniref:hypothetical protein n=1 Tax=unclassified Paenibacillus TaxID=185978 RepID=UPI001AE65050|nr:MULTISPECIES: hypothetical protein [unclassified Paenibacillus]MBP1155048.1 hypothetical protein [Paenibacillus sp. PvP091]MBP1169569.1 hypothetical protein [Paenibacillus sp. PvR098]MBP2440597.1 hypothetical protein [Paenibacillus sp. PvP052]
MRRWFVSVLGGMLILGVLSGCSGEGGAGDAPTGTTPSDSSGTMTPAPTPDSGNIDSGTGSPSTIPDTKDGAGGTGTLEPPQAK